MSESKKEIPKDESEDELKKKKEEEKRAKEKRRKEIGEKLLLIIAILALVAIGIAFISYLVTSFYFLGFTAEVYFSNLQFLADIYVVFFVPYSYYLYKKIPEGYVSIVKEIPHLFVPFGEKRKYLRDIKKKKVYRFIIPSIFAVLFFLATINILLLDPNIIWGSYILDVDPSHLEYAKFYKLTVSFMIGWLGFFGFYSIIRYWTVSKNISNLIKHKIYAITSHSTIKEISRFINLHTKFKRIFRYHLKRTFHISMLCYPLFVIGVMYSFLFEYWHAGMSYLIIGGILCLFILFIYVITGKKLKQKIESKKNHALKRIQSKLDRVDLLNLQKAKEMFYLQKLFSIVKELTLVKKVPPTTIAILISIVSLIIISTNIFAPNEDLLFRITIFYVAIGFMIYFIIYYRIKLSD